jgi:hypothetical protein
MRAAASLQSVRSVRISASISADVNSTTRHQTAALRLDLEAAPLDRAASSRRGSITQESLTVFLVGHQATDDQLNGFQ